MLAVRKALGLLVSLIALAGLLVTVVLATRRIDLRPRTDDGSGYRGRVEGTTRRGP